MTSEEFSVEFDIYWNNISSNKAPGLSPYEKSTILTQAQELVVKDLYSGASGPYEKTEEVTEYLQSITKQRDYTQVTSAEEASSGPSLAKLAEAQWEVEIPEDLWFVVYEQAIITRKDCDNVVAQVIPVNHNDFYKTSDSPFKGANGRRILRLTIGGKFELYSSKDNDIVSYTCRYLRKPTNIVLPGISVSNGDCPAEFVPNGYDPTTGITSELPDSLHRIILIRAVQLAKSIWN